MVVLVPALLLFIGLVVGGARVWWAQTSVQAMADSGARQASISRTPAQASSTAEALVRRDAAASALACTGGLGVRIDTAGFRVPVGQPATAGASVTCTVRLSDLLVPGFPGTYTVDASARSTLDRYRGRQ